MKSWTNFFAAVLIVAVLPVQLFAAAKPKVALVLGGMPLSGGPHSKISAALIGAATITVLNSGLVIMGAGTGTIQIFRGVIFLAVVLVASLNYRTQLLPR